MKTTINGDSSAVKGILARRGCGKVKHLEVKQFWLQEQVRSGKVEFQKISRKNNPSDALTHHYTREEAKKHFEHMGIEFIPTSSEAVRGDVCANLGETKDKIEEEATCASLLGSPPLGNDTHGGSTTKKGVGEEAGKKHGKTSFLPVLRSMPKIIPQDSFRQGWRSPTTEMFRETGKRSVRSEKSEVSNNGEGFHVNSSWNDQLRKEECF